MCSGNFSSRLVHVVKAAMPSATILLAITLIVFAVPSKGDEVDIECIPFHKCPDLFNLLKENPISQKTITLLKTSQCGFDGNHPKVWCARFNSAVCKTPDGKEGNCVPLQKCEPFIQLLQTLNDVTPERKAYLQKFQCNNPSSNNGLSVCCPNDKELAVNSPSIPSSIPLSIPLSIPSSIPSSTPSSLIPIPANGECGQQLQDRILGGKVTEMDEFPWTALLEYSGEFQVGAVCAGTLISKKYVVTAAHCVDNSAIRRFGSVSNVILGEFDIRNETDCINSLGVKDCADPPIKIPVEEVIVYPQWLTRQRGVLNHDIALLRLAFEVPFSDYVKPICLPSSTLTMKEKQKLMIAGWGLTENGRESFVKRKATLPVANRQACLRKYIEDKNIIVGDGELCAGGEEGVDSCSGDSGGPLMLKVDRNGIASWFLVGVVSFGPNQPCGMKDYPGLYTYIPQYVDWIRKTVRP